MSRPDNTRIQKTVSMYADRLGEWTDSCLIVASRNNPDGTSTRFVGGSGDYFAQYGLARDWVNDREETARCRKDP